ncbi:hypothetical protein D3C87_1643280 [compost metagenome]
MRQMTHCIDLVIQFFMKVIVDIAMRLLRVEIQQIAEHNPLFLLSCGHIRIRRIANAPVYVCGYRLHQQFAGGIVDIIL